MLKNEQGIYLDAPIGKVEDACYDVNVDVEKVGAAGHAVVEYVNTLLATEREAVIEECARVADAHRSTCAAAIRALKGPRNIRLFPDSDTGYGAIAPDAAMKGQP